MKKITILTAIALVLGVTATSLNAQTTSLGNIDGVTVGSPVQLRLVGWFGTPRAGATPEVVVTANGKRFTTVRPSLARPDVARVHPNLGGFTGFEVPLTVLGPGKHRVCAVGNPGAVNMGCRNVTIAGTSVPFGNLEAITQTGPGRVRVSGWALDADTKNSIDVQINVDGKFNARTKADRSRPDVAKEWQPYGDKHGWSVEITVPGGTRRICAWGLNVGAGANNGRVGACRDFTVKSGNPVGKTETISQNRVVGWAIDPDTAESIDVHVYVNNRYFKAGKANGYRPDIGNQNPGYGNDHGFAVDLGNTPVGATICVYAINKGSGNVNTNLGCVKK